ncbi:MAG: DNA alkylation repair protein [Candidatus Kapabacteria bacterium]|jgi:3-methyladenine DNA glycosylase AlkD|nr:DNA alkylation repair protein [Candidatus Kapabacteria bacterium]
MKKIKMTLQEVMTELKGYADENTKKTYMRHGAREPYYGVKVQDVKKIVKKIKKDHELSLELYATGNSDAMYMAGLIADESKISKDELRQWADGAYWYMISEYPVPWVAAESPYAIELALEWMESDEERIASCGWATLGYYAALKEDSELDIEMYSSLLDRAEKNVHNAQNQVRYTMNGFVIAVGAYISELTAKASEVGGRIGKVEVDMGGTACKVPLAKDYIKKVVDKGRIGKKRKSARC